jgi:hypothetical protein
MVDGHAVRGLGGCSPSSSHPNRAVEARNAGPLAPATCPRPCSSEWSEATRVMGAPFALGTPHCGVLVADEGGARQSLGERLGALRRLVASRAACRRRFPFKRGPWPAPSIDWMPMSVRRDSVSARRLGRRGHGGNDVVLATVAGCDRVLPFERPGYTNLDRVRFRSGTPVSVRSPEVLARSANRVSAWTVDLPDHRTRSDQTPPESSASTPRHLKGHEGGALDAETLTPRVATVGRGFGAALARRPPSRTWYALQNMVVPTNVPGPRTPLYLTGVGAC